MKAFLATFSLHLGTALKLSISARPPLALNVARKPAMSPTIPSGTRHKFDPIRRRLRVRREGGREGGRERGRKGGALLWGVTNISRPMYQLLIPPF